MLGHYRVVSELKPEVVLLRSLLYRHQRITVDDKPNTGIRQPQTSQVSSSRAYPPSLDLRPSCSSTTITPNKALHPPQGSSLRYSHPSPFTASPILNPSTSAHIDRMSPLRFHRSQNTLGLADTRAIPGPVSNPGHVPRSNSRSRDRERLTLCEWGGET